jgi:hypothetical protein
MKILGVIQTEVIVAPKPPVTQMTWGNCVTEAQVEPSPPPPPPPLCYNIYFEGWVLKVVDSLRGYMLFRSQLNAKILHHDFQSCINNPEFWNLKSRPYHQLQPYKFNPLVALANASDIQSYMPESDRILQYYQTKYDQCTN